jgi:hypothetical protein
MWSKKDVLIFFAGGEAFHTLSHILLPMYIHLPIQIGPINYTQQWNMYAIGINTLITIALLWWVSRTK